MGEGPGEWACAEFIELGSPSGDTFWDFEHECIMRSGVHQGKLFRRLLGKLMAIRMLTYEVTKYDG